MLLPSLLAALVAASPADSVPACSALASATDATVASDLAAALSTHGAVARWEERPIVVWLQARPQDAASARHGAGEWREALAAGIASWNGIVSNLRVVVGRDSARADVHVVWARTLATAPNDPAAGALANLTAGRTTVAVTETGRIAAATVTLATTAPNGASYLPADARAVVRHELGHAVGLAHHAAPTSVMAPLVVAERIGEEDRAVLRALYRLPVGTACAAR